MSEFNPEAKTDKLRKSFWALIILVFLGCASALVWYLMKDDAAERQQRPIAVLVEEVRSGSLSRKITAVGTLIANQTVMVRPEINGVMGKIHVRGGELLKEGELLFELDNRQISAELKEAEAKLNFANVEFNRASALAAKNFGSQQKMDDAKAKKLVAEAQVESGKLKLERTLIKAPFTGLVGVHNLSIGAVVGPDKELTTFVDISPMQVDFKIPAQYMKFINEGQRVDVFIDGFTTDKPTLGIISNIDSKIDPNSHSVVVRALIANKQGLLRPGIFARVDLVVGAKDNVMIVPETAVMTAEGNEQVYKVFEGIAYKVDIRTGLRDGESVEVVQGLNLGDHIILEGHAKIKDQYPVRYELDGKQYSFDEAAFKKKMEAFEEKKKALESGEASSMGKSEEQNSEPKKDETAANPKEDVKKEPEVKADGAQKTTASDNVKSSENSAATSSSSAPKDDVSKDDVKPETDTASSPDSQA